MSRSGKLTPMFRQFFTMKEQHPDDILFFRMGDFFEMFFEDAKIAARALGLALTARGTFDGKPIPMCGLPHEKANHYLSKLIEQGFTVAVCDQVEDPKTAKGIVKREVVRVVSKGMTVDPASLSPTMPNYLACLAETKGAFGMSALDLTTGRFMVFDCEDEQTAFEELLRLQPAELLVDENAPPRPWTEPSTLAGAGWAVSQVTIPRYARAERTLTEFFGVASLEGFGVAGFKAGLNAAAATLDYVIDRQRVKPSHIHQITPSQNNKVLIVDEASRRNLELVESLMGGGKDGSLLNIIDRTVTPMGARKLREWLLYPRRDFDTIVSRHDAVDELLFKPDERTELRERLDELPDLERIAGRAVMGQATPRDLAALRRGLLALPELVSLGMRLYAEYTTQTIDDVDSMCDIADELSQGLVDNPPATLADGGVIRPEFNKDLDEITRAATEGKSWIASLEAKERQRTGIPNLKVGYNRVFGYYIEVSKAKTDAVPDDFTRKQTLVAAERFITPELKEVEEKVLGAEEKRIELEIRLFTKIRDNVANASRRIIETAGALARLDVLAALAQVAEELDFQKPKMHLGEELSISAGRHPMVEKNLPAGEFVPNDIFLDHLGQQVLIITGPNMAGKSTVLRQTAIIVLLAHLGCFVPAKEALIPVTDRIFTRVGAADDLARGRSTFMVEMCETANIIHNATARSLVVLDEVGRGTSTFDGLSIAWAVAEHLHDMHGVGVKTLFATHYHELTELAEVFPRIKNFTVAVKEVGDEVLFLRQLIKGGVSRSYGIQVARLAGLPQKVLDRAREVLGLLETGDSGRPGRLADEAAAKGQADQLSLFTPQEHPALKILAEVDADRLTPIEALNLIHRLKEEA